MADEYLRHFVFLRQARRKIGARKHRCAYVLAASMIHPERRPRQTRESCAGPSERWGEREPRSRCVPPTSIV
jgi:hypothetical protein